MKSVCVQGLRIPALGLGTVGLHGEEGRRIIGHALEIGYRHIDTAQIYDTEAEVGDAIRGSSVPRQEIWLTTKLWPDRFRDGDLQRAAEESLRRLGCEPDLLLLHWPSGKVPLEETIGALNDVERRGLAGHIGVSNFPVALMERALALSDAPLIVNQVEYHPYLSQWTLLAALRAREMALTAYAPLAQGKVFGDALLRRIGAGYGKGAGQVALRWLLQQEGVAAIPRSRQPAHVEANLSVFDFALTETEMAQISARASPHGRLVDTLRGRLVWDDLDGIGQARRYARGLVRALGRRLARLRG